VTDPDADAITTARLRVRPPREADRDRFVELFRDAGFMEFYPAGALTEQEARDRFDQMKQVPVLGDIRNLCTLPVGPPVR
jgi:RimJ/RimL family protein N-acetyltransferase